MRKMVKTMSEEKNKIKLFEEKQVRTIWDKENEKWWFMDYIIRKDVEAALPVSQPMAVRILKSLVLKGNIRAVGSGKNTRYVMN